MLLTPALNYPLVVASIGMIYAIWRQYATYADRRRQQTREARDVHALGRGQPLTRSDHRGGDRMRAAAAVVFGRPRNGSYNALPNLPPNRGPPCSTASLTWASRSTMSSWNPPTPKSSPATWTCAPT